MAEMLFIECQLQLFDSILLREDMDALEKSVRAFGFAKPYLVSQPFYQSFVDPCVPNVPKLRELRIEKGVRNRTVCGACAYFYTVCMVLVSEETSTPTTRKFVI